MDCIFSTSVYDLSAKHKRYELKWKKQGAVTYSKDQENKVTKMFLTSLGN